MARNIKHILEHGIDKRDVGYYSTPDFVAQYMFEEMIKLNSTGSSVMDPAVGRGELIESFLEAGLKVDGFDIIDYHNRIKKFQFYHEDFLARFINDKDGLKQQAYDFIILNPPFNCHQHSYIATNKPMLNRHFKTGTFNLYSLFVEAAIEVAKEGCIIGVIVPDSILFGKAYDKLRSQIIENCEIKQIILCPSYLFRKQGANINTCILIIRKTNNNLHDIIHIANRTSNIEKFQILLKKRNLKDVHFSEIYYRADAKSGIFVFDFPRQLMTLFSTYPRLGENFICGGGVSTGDNKQFTSVEKREGFDIPYYSNVSTRFLATPESFLCHDFIEQSQGTRKFIVRHPDKLEYDGIVCSGIGKRFYAAYLPKEGVTGVNAAVWPGKEDLYWLLSYLNCSLVTYLLKGVIARSHITTIGNVASLPIIPLSDAEKRSLGRISKQAINGKLAPADAVAKIDRIVYNSINASQKTRKIISQFCGDIIHLV